MTDEPIVFRFSSECGLEEDSNKLIYIGGRDSKDLDGWVAQNLDRLPKLLEAPEGCSNSYKIAFLPAISAAICGDAIAYNYPTLNDFKADLSRSSFPYDKVWNYLLSSSERSNCNPMPESGGFLQYDDNFGRILEFNFFPITARSECEFLEAFEAFSHSLPQKDNNVLYSNIGTVDLSGCFGIFTGETAEKDADGLFDEESKQLAQEIRERISKLRLNGIEDVVIRSLFEPQPKLSRLVITADYRITLPDFNDMEIKMEPLPKAVYFLFLRHPKGILFKNLPDYEDELKAIYRMLTNKIDISAAYESIKRIVNPYDNSINEKCARIRSAFVEKMDDRVARNYYIIGERNRVKYVKIAYLEK